MCICLQLPYVCTSLNVLLQLLLPSYVYMYMYMYSTPGPAPHPDHGLILPGL